VVDASFLRRRRASRIKIAAITANIKTRPAIAIPMAKLRCEMQMLFGSSGVWKFDKFHKLQENSCYMKKYIFLVLVLKCLLKWSWKVPENFQYKSALNNLSFLLYVIVKENEIVMINIWPMQYYFLCCWFMKSEIKLKTCSENVHFICSTLLLQSTSEKFPLSLTIWHCPPFTLLVNP